MKHQALFSMKDKSRKNKVSSAAIYVCTLKVNIQMVKEYQLILV